MEKKIKFYGADIYNDINPRIELGARFLGTEDYVGICKKSNWNNPILVTIKDNKLVARPIVIDKEQDSYYCYSTDINIGSILSSEDIKYLNRIVKQSMDAHVPLIELSDKLELDENILFNHAIQNIDKNAFRDFSQAKKKDNSINMTEFVKKTHENSDINKLNADIERLTSNRQQIVNASKEIDVFKTIKPVSAKEIREIYANNGFYNVSKEEILDIAKKINGNLGTYLIETFKSRIITDIAKTRIKTNNYKGYISESTIKHYIQSSQIKFTDEVETKIVKDILNECNNNDKMRNLSVANNLSNKFGDERSKKLDVSYTLAISEKLNEMTQAQKNKKPIHNALLTESDIKTYSDNPESINLEDVQYVANELNDSTSSIIASSVKTDIIFDLIEQYNKGIPFKYLTVNDLKSKYGINDKYAQQLAAEINSMIQGYIQSKENAKENHTPWAIDCCDEKTVQSGKNR